MARRRQGLIQRAVERGHHPVRHVAPARMPEGLRLRDNDGIGALASTDTHKPRVDACTESLGKL